MRVRVESDPAEATLVPFQPHALETPEQINARAKHNMETLNGVT